MKKEKCSLQFETLEDRCVPAVLTVNTLTDEVTAGNDTLSLREALDVIDGTTAVNTLSAAAQAQITGNINEAGNPDVVVFDFSLNGGTTTLTNGELDVNSVNSQVIIDGTGLLKGITIDADSNSRVMNLRGANDITLRGLTITGGLVTGAGLAGFGGGILTSANLTADATIDQCWIHSNQARSGAGIGANNTGNQLIVLNSTISGNSANQSPGPNQNYGGAISTNGIALRVTNSTIANNSSLNYGGAFELYQVASGQVVITNTTISGNTATQAGGGIWQYSANVGDVVQLNNSILIGNTAGAGNDAYLYFGTLNSNGGNVTGDIVVSGNANLTGNANDVTNITTQAAIDTVLASTTIVAPNDQALIRVPFLKLTNSATNPALNKGINGDAVLPNTTTALSFDQRGTGFARINGGTVDAGAFEMISAAPQSTVDKQLYGIGRALLGRELSTTQFNQLKSSVTGNNFDDAIEQLFQNQTAVTRIITQMYHYVLNRAPDQAGLDFWVQNISSGANDIRLTFERFLFSDEIVQQGAAATAAGIAVFLRNTSDDLPAVQAAIQAEFEAATSTEAFSQNFVNNDTRFRNAFLDFSYLMLLNRSPAFTAADGNFWFGPFNQGLDLLTILKTMATSDEFENNFDSVGGSIPLVDTMQS